MLYECLWIVPIHIRTLAFITIIYYLISSVSSKSMMLVVKDSEDDRIIIAYNYFFSLYHMTHVTDSE